MNTVIGSIVDENNPFEKHWIQEERLPLNTQKFTEFRQKFLYPYVEPQSSTSLDAVAYSIRQLARASNKATSACIDAVKSTKEFNKQLKQVEEIIKNNKTMQETIYYVDKKEVKIGDKISLSGWNVILTEQLIKDCPDMFEVKREELELTVGEWYWVKHKDERKYEALVCFQGAGNKAYGLNHTREWTRHYGGIHVWRKNLHRVSKASKEDVEKRLLEEANRRYPEGTRFVPFWDGLVERVIVESKGNAYWSGSGDMGINTSNFGNCPYVNGKWAEIVEPIMTSEDGVDMYEGDKYWWVSTRENIALEAFVPHDEGCVFLQSGKNPDYDFKNNKFFSTEQAAEEWIKENKPKEKTLNDYENMLLNSKKELDGECVSIDEEDLFDVLRQNYPKLYWTQVLQLIADDLNEEFGEYWTFIELDKGHYTTGFYGAHYSCNHVKFSATSIAKKAIKLMGDKLDYIFK